LDFVIEIIDEEDFKTNAREPTCASVCIVSGQKSYNEFSANFEIESPIKIRFWIF
jgi:hypothetical protein